jgi:hypothetical protein
MKNAKVFGRVRDNGSYQNLFECSCGCRDWIKEYIESEMIYECRVCGERYVLVKKPGRHYMIEESIRPDQSHRN